MKRSVLFALALAVLLLPQLAQAEAATVPVAPASSVEAPAAELPADNLEALFLSTGCTAEKTCSSGQVITCDAGPGDTCTTTGSGVTCGSCSVSCGPVDQWAACISNCGSQYLACRTSCVSQCSDRICLGDCWDDCADTRDWCESQCGNPQTHCSG